MRLHIYHGLDNENVPKDVTHVIVDNSVTVIKRKAFCECRHLVSLTMGDNVKSIEREAFYYCLAIRFIRLSKALEYIEAGAFYNCESSEVLFLPSTVKSIGRSAFRCCRSMRFLILPHDIDLGKVGNRIIYQTGIEQFARTAGVEYNWNNDLTEESNRRVNEWLFHHMDDAPFHMLCYDSSVTTKQISDFLDEHGNDSALAIDTIHGMTPLHILSMNPHAPADTILTLLKTNINAANVGDNRGKTPLYYALYYNPCAFVRMYSYLHEHNTNTIENENQSLVVIADDGDRSTPLHVLAKNPFAPADAIAALLELKMEAAFCPDDEAGMSPLDYAKECNVEGLVSMIAVLCNHRNSMPGNKVVEYSKKGEIQE